MKTITLAIALLASITLAKPLLDKRYMVTSVVLETRTVTVTASGNWWNWGSPSATPTAKNTVSVISSSPSTSSTASASSTSPATPTSAPSTSSSPAIASTSSTQAPGGATASASQPTTSLSAYAQPILDQHNVHRYNHSAPPLVWDHGLANIAQEIASSCVYAHNVKAGGGGYGQNIGAGAPDDEVDKMITDQMYNDEMMFYPGYGTEPDMSNFEKWGHFSQIVWKSTTGVGCYTQHCTGGLSGVGSNVAPYFTVCNYAGVGNFGGEYAANVLAPRGDPPIFL